jgi:hypothetical protein
MHQPERSIRWRLSALTVAACCLGSLAGCQLLDIFAVHNDPPKPASPVTVSAPRPPADAAVVTARPGKCEYRNGQYVFLADFEINRAAPIFKELTDLHDHVHKTLQLPTSNNLIQVYLFEDRDRYDRFMAATHPELPRRRAFFFGRDLMGGKELLVYVFWGNGDRIQQDLRHELTHALLHSVLKDVPLWLDEGLAEYFELPPANLGVNADHLRYLRYASCDLSRLEQLTEVEQMTAAEYREAWAWVHLMLHSNEEARKVLIGYLHELQKTKSPGLLRPRLAGVFPANLEMALERHLAVIDTARGPSTAAK